MFLRSLGLMVIGMAAAVAADRPNIVWIFSDDHAYQAIGAYGGRFADEDLTPNLDRLAFEGMRFDRAFVGNSICAPSRATLLTGKHSHKNGKLSNRGAFNHDQAQFQKVLQANGYQTAMIGKIHLDGAMQGFDYWEVLPGQGVYTNPTFITAAGKTQYEGHCTDIVTDRALNWLQNDRDPNKPFLAMIHYKAPHRTWIPAPRFQYDFAERSFPEPETLFDDYAGRRAAADQKMTIAKHMWQEKDLLKGREEDIISARRQDLNRYQPKGDDLTRWKYQLYMRDYLACIAGIDENVGRVLAWLDEQGLAENTVVMYSADQGFYLGEHGWYDKRFMYEQSMRTPLLARWPGVIAPGSVNSDLVQNIDFAPTFLDIASAPIAADIQGHSVVPLLRGQTPADWRKSLYYHYYEYPCVHSVRRHEGVRSEFDKLIRFYGKDVPDGEQWEYYDLRSDSQELHNRYADPACDERIKALKAELQRLRDHYEVPADDALSLPELKQPAKGAGKASAKDDA
ncbi:MAG: sulfatase family protein [Planctomycetota bacterium]|jgi:arylsulfatase A-like enzyme